MKVSENLMTDTKEGWIKVGTVLTMVPGDVPSQKTEKFSNFEKNFENVIFSIFNLFFIKIMLLWDTFGKVNN